jgi:hypothetical protein
VSSVVKDSTTPSTKVTQGELEGEGDLDLKSFPLPESGSEFALAAWLFEEANVPCDNAMIKIGGDCIRKLAREAGICNRDAAQVILDAMKAAIVEGEQITRFWLTDQRYKPQKPKKSGRRAEIEAERAEVIRRLEAEDASQTG